MIRKLLLAAALSPLVLQAQSFFFGQPGPGIAQLETRINQEGRGITIPKYFDKEHNYLVAAPFSFDENGMRNVGLNVGYLAQDIGSENTDMIFAVGLFRNSNGEYKTISPQVYFTQTIPINKKYFATIDTEGAAASDTAIDTTTLRGAILPGIGTKRIRGGVGFSAQEGRKPIYTFEGRLDSKHHDYWFTTSLELNKKEIRIGFFYNVKEK